jgi:hexosaminidase
VIDGDRVVVRAVEPAGVARALTTLIQVAAMTPPGGAAEVCLPGTRILDSPRYAWRGLSLDLARTFFTVGEIRRVIDLLELYKLNVLHLHLTDDQSWRLPVGRSAHRPEPGAAFYSGEDLGALAAYAADRFVTIVPEVDTPGHASALLQLHPELNTGRNYVELELPPGHKHNTVWLDPELPATFELIEQVLAGVTAIFPGPYVHIGGDEAHGMPHDLYASYVQRLRRLVRSLGRRPLGWQESARAGLGSDDIIQYWFTGIALRPSLPPQFRAQMDADLALSRRDVEAAAAVPVPVIASPLSYCYLDVPYAEPSADPAQTDRSAASVCACMPLRPSPSRLTGNPPTCSGPAGQRRSRESKLPSGPRPSLASRTCLSCCCLAWSALPTRPGAPRSSPAGPATVTASPDTVGCGPKTASRTSAPPPWTGSEPPASAPICGQPNSFV